MTLMNRFCVSPVAHLLGKLLSEASSFVFVAKDTVGID